MDGAGNRIQPAWDKFAEYMASPETGAEPGKVFYHDGRASTNTSREA